MKVLAAAACALLVLVQTSAAQTPLPPMPKDFAIYSAVDFALQFSPGGPLVIAGWQFECRSGIQAYFDRLGYPILLLLSETNFTPYSPRQVQAYGHLARPDVLAAFQPSCVQMGPRTGYWLYLNDQIRPDRYTVLVGWVAFDGYGRQAPVHYTTVRGVVVQ